MVALLTGFVLPNCVCLPQSALFVETRSTAAYKPEVRKCVAKRWQANS